MAFCNSCGATLDASTKFCNKCGAAVPAASVPPVGTPAATAPAQGGNNSALKIILIIVAVVVGLGILGVATMTYIGYRVAHSARVMQKNGHTKIESPFGNLEANTDPSDAAKNLGIDLYPGAQMQKDGYVSMNIMGSHMATAILQTSDAPSEVADFYHGKLPNATMSCQGSNYSLSTGGKDDMTAIGIRGEGSFTKITITRTTKASN